MIASALVGQATWPWLNGGDWLEVAAMGNSDKDDLGQ